MELHKTIHHEWMIIIVFISYKSPWIFSSYMDSGLASVSGIQGFGCGTGTRFSISTVDLFSSSKLIQLGAN